MEVLTDNIDLYMIFSTYKLWFQGHFYKAVYLIMLSYTDSEDEIVI